MQLLAATPAVDVGVNDTFYKAGWYNPLTSRQLAWDLGNGWGFSYLVGMYWDVNSPTAWSTNDFNQRFALSYTGNGWNLTANAIWGIDLGIMSPADRKSRLVPYRSNSHPTGAIQTS